MGNACKFEEVETLKVVVVHLTKEEGQLPNLDRLFCRVVDASKRGIFCLFSLIAYSKAFETKIIVLSFFGNKSSIYSLVSVDLLVTTNGEECDSAAI